MLPDTEDTLFRIIDASQGLQRRVMRAIARKSLNQFAIDELRAQANGILDEIASLSSAEA